MLAPDLYEQVVLQTVIADSESGEIEEDTLINGIDGVFFACNSVSSDVGCATVLLPDPTRADGEPPGPSDFGVTCPACDSRESGRRSVMGALDRPRGRVRVT